MNSDTILDYAQFQLSPRRTRCELFVSGGGKTEKLASGFLKPFLTHLKVAEEQANQAVRAIKLDVEKRKNAGTWFNKGTLERFVRFVSTPEVLELVNTYDAEMSQLEGARKIYSLGAGDQLFGENESAAAAAADITKKELLRAMDVRLTALNQDLATACARASAAGFTLDTVSELLLFADRFGALRLIEASTKFISLCQRRPELVSHQRSPSLLIPSQWKGFDDANIHASSSSDMSIDEPVADAAIPFRQSISGTSDTGRETLKPTSAQPIDKSAAEIQPSVRLLMEKGTSKTKGDPSPSVAPSDEQVQPPAAGSRRLSVQDRINLFESKQKEQSGSASISSSGSGGGGINKVVAGKGEHRRLPSDASIEKSVLRRWSGASDMSIDLTNNSSDRKESGSAVGTPTSSAHSHVQSESKIEVEAGLLKDMATSWPKLGPKDNSSTTYSSSSLSSSQTETSSFPKDRDGADDVLLKEVTTTTYKTQSGLSMEKAHGGSQTQFGTSMGGAHQGGFSDETNTLSSSKPASESGECAKLKDHTASLIHFNEVALQNIGMKDQAASQIPSRAVPVTVVKAKPKDQAGADSDGQKSQAPSTTKFKTFAGKTEDDGDKPKDRLDSQFHSKASLGKEGITPQRDLPSRSQWNTFSGNQEAGRKEEATASHMSLKVSSEDSSGSQRLQLHGRTSAPDQTKKLQGRRDERLASQGTSIPVFSVTKTKKQEHVLQLPSTPPLEQAQVLRPLKGNSELNDELQMKADELEKLFAAHKLRVHGDQTASSRRSKTIEGQVLKSTEKRPVEVPADQFSEGNLPSEVLSNGVEFDTNLLMKIVDNLDSANSMKQKLGSISPSNDSRGKLYERYMQKRDAKLREEWGLKRAQNEAKMKAMHDSLKCSQEEMKAKLAGSSDKRDSVLARRRAEKMISFNLRSAIKNQGQTVDPVLGEGDLQERDQVLYGQDRSLSDTLSGNESSTSSKRLVSSNSLSSSTPRTSAAPIPKPSAKATNSGSVRRRTQPENPLSQSIPNFSDLRKENTKPVTGLSKVTSCTQPRTFARSKSATEEANLVKEEKSRRSHSMRKSLAIPGELTDLTPLSSDGANLTTLKFQKEQMKQCVNKIQKSGELKPFLRKGNGVGPGTGAGLSKLTASTNCEAHDEDSEGLMGQREDSPDTVKDYEEEFDKTSTEGNLQTPDFPVESDGDNGDPGSENGDVLSSLSQDVDDSIAVSSKFNSSAGNVLASPGESPGSWNSNVHHTFSYAREASNIDASVDSPTGSPASWNSHPFNQLMEADAARMRKKWGSAQMPVLVANAQHQQRKDMTKGFKRLLKFGRKSKGADYLVNDWVSASTASEGDDDTEDGRELGSRTSDELRKSRMGYSVAAYDGFNDGDNFPEQVQSLRSSIPNAPTNFKLREDHLSGGSIKAPRSFFSLSSFRSKGSEAKPR